MTIYNRVKKNKKYVKKSFPISIARDKRLTKGQVGLIYYLLSCSDDWNVVKKNVVMEFIKRGDTKNSIEEDWKHLMSLGYIQIKRLGGKQGSSWIINEVSNDYRV